MTTTSAIKSIKINPSAKKTATPATPAKKNAKTATPTTPVTPVDMITITLPAGSRETTRWIIAPNTDGHERWFDKNKIHGYTSIKDVKKGTGATVTIKRAELSYRGKTFRGIAANA